MARTARKESSLIATLKKNARHKDKLIAELKVENHSQVVEIETLRREVSLLKQQQARYKNNNDIIAEYAAFQMERQQRSLIGRLFGVYIK